MVIVIDDGVATLTYDSETHEYILRDHTGVESGRGYSSQGVVYRVTSKICALSEMRGHMSLRHMCLLARLLRQLGYTTAYRPNDFSQHRPWGEVVGAGFWQGMVHVDLLRIPTTTESA